MLENNSHISEDIQPIHSLLSSQEILIFLEIIKRKVEKYASDTYRKIPLDISKILFFNNDQIIHIYKNIFQTQWIISLKQKHQISEFFCSTGVRGEIRKLSEKIQNPSIDGFDVDEILDMAITRIKNYDKVANIHTCDRETCIEKIDEYNHLEIYEFRNSEQLYEYIGYNKNDKKIVEFQKVHYKKITKVWNNIFVWYDKDAAYFFSFQENWTLSSLYHSYKDITWYTAFNLAITENNDWKKWIVSTQNNITPIQWNNCEDICVFSDQNIAILSFINANNKAKMIFHLIDMDHPYKRIPLWIDASSKHTYSIEILNQQIIHIYWWNMSQYAILTKKEEGISAIISHFHDVIDIENIKDLDFKHPFILPGKYEETYVCSWNWKTHTFEILFTVWENDLIEIEGNIIKKNDIYFYAIHGEIYTFNQNLVEYVWEWIILLKAKELSIVQFFRKIFFSETQKKLWDAIIIRETTVEKLVQEKILLK